jgi:hypothetical protein
MRQALIRCLTVLLGSAVLVPAARAGDHSPADYPLRVHIFQFNSHSHYYRPGGGPYGTLENVDGEGRANLYENGEPKGFDFSYECGTRIMTSEGYETYMARWRKPGRELEVLLPVLGGKPGAMNECDLKVALKEDSAYYRHEGLLNEEPAAKFKDWMVRHQYDPEHGLNEPVNLPSQSEQPAQPVPPAQPAKPVQPGAPAASSQ